MKAWPQNLRTELSQQNCSDKLHKVYSYGSSTVIQKLSLSKANAQRETSCFFYPYVYVLSYLYRYKLFYWSRKSALEFLFKHSVEKQSCFSFFWSIT